MAATAADPRLLALAIRRWNIKPENRLPLMEALRQVLASKESNADRSLAAVQVFPEAERHNLRMARLNALRACALQNGQPISDDDPRCQSTVSSGDS